MLPLFPVRVRCHGSALGTRKLEFVEVLREVFQDRTVPRLLLQRPFTLQLCGGQKRSLPPPPPPSTPTPSFGLKRHSSADLGPTMEELQLGGGSKLQLNPPLRPAIWTRLELNSIKCDVINRKPRHFLRPLLADCSMNRPPPQVSTPLPTVFKCLRPCLCIHLN